MRKYFLLIHLLMLMAYSYADVGSTQISSTIEQNTVINSTNSGIPQAWGLTQAQWNRYQQLMQGADKFWYPNLTPPEILGLNAQTAKEQQYYAELVAKEEHDKLARELAFNNAVHQAALKLFTNEPIIQPFNQSIFNPIKLPSSLSNGNSK